MREYKIFYPANNYKGKWHTIDLTGVATCHPQIMDMQADPIHVTPDQEKIHPMICKRCLEAK